MTEQTELRPCPYCGSSVTERAHEYPEPHRAVWWIECDNCTGQTGEYHNRGLLIRAWNRRADNDELDAVRRALNGYADSDLAGLAEVMMSQRRLLAEALVDTLPTVVTEDDIAPDTLRLAYSIVADEPAPASGWISVDERLPEPGQAVLCYCGDALETILQRHVDPGGMTTHIFVARELVLPDGSRWADEGVTHWQPLPPPPGSDEPAPAGDETGDDDGKD